jgi:hypothetical protein
MHDKSGGDEMARNPEKEIMLVVTGQGIMAHWLVSGQPDPEIVKAFGTNIIPTPYIGASTMPKAIKEIERLNPDHKVSTV